MPLSLTDRLAGRGQLPPVLETDLDRILKLIPTEVLAVYTSTAPLADRLRWTSAPLVLFVVGITLVPLVLFLDSRAMNAPACWPQYIVRTLAFIPWALSLSWPFTPWLQQADLMWVTSLAVLLIPLLGGYLVRTHNGPRG